MDRSCFPVKQRHQLEVEWTKYSDLYEIIHPSLCLIFFVFAECEKSLLYFIGNLFCQKQGVTIWIWISHHVAAKTYKKLMDSDSVNENLNIRICF